MDIGAGRGQSPQKFMRVSKWGLYAVRNNHEILVYDLGIEALGKASWLVQPPLHDPGDPGAAVSFL